MKLEAVADQASHVLYNSSLGLTEALIKSPNSNPNPILLPTFVKKE